jgi:chitin-binding protein
MPGKLPKGRTGRHMIYTIWQTSSTPDTYYSCSDVTFGSASVAPSGSGSAGGETAPPAGAGAGAPAGLGDPRRTSGGPVAVSLAATGTRSVWPLAAAGAVGSMIVGLVLFALRRRFIG